MPTAGQKVLAADHSGHGYDFEVANDTSASTSYVDGTVHGTAFAAPTSGSVWIRFGGLLGSNDTTLGLRAEMSIYVRTGATVDAGSDVLAAGASGAVLRHYDMNTNASFSYDQVSGEYLLTGLTAGSSYNVITQYRAVTSGTAGTANRWIAVAAAHTS